MKNNFKSIESLENFLTWQYLTNLGKTPKEVAYKMDVNEQKLIEWINNRSARMNQIMKSQKGKVDTIMVALAKKYRVKKSEEPEVPNIDIKKVIPYLAEGYNWDEIAQKLHYKPKNFKRWLFQAGKLAEVNKAVGQYNNNP